MERYFIFTSYGSPSYSAFIGHGRATNFWLDPWLKDGRIKDLYPSRIIYDLHMGESVSVSQFISPQGWLLPPPTSGDLITLCGKIQNDIHPKPSFSDEVVHLCEPWRSMENLL